MKLIEHTLLEQMKFSEHEIERRKEMFAITSEVASILRKHRPTIIRDLDKITDEFYSVMTEFDEISLTIGDSETLGRLRNSMSKYIVELFDGCYDSEYVNKRLRVGKVHKQIGVTPKMYVSAISRLQSALVNSIDNVQNAHKANEGIDKDDYVGARDAIIKLLHFDVHLVFETYLSSMVAALELAKSETEIYAEDLELKVAERTKQLEELSMKDPLTNLFNQRAFYESLLKELAVAQRQKQSLSLIYFDLNGFKSVNDHHGHQEGNAILQIIAETVLEVVRISDVPCRYGGDEFCIILPTTDNEEAIIVCERLVESFKKKNNLGVSMSFGIAQAGPAIFPKSDQLVVTADREMYKAKTKSRKRPGYYLSYDSIVTEVGGEKPTLIQESNFQSEIGKLEGSGYSILAK